MAPSELKRYLARPSEPLAPETYLADGVHLLRMGLRRVQPFLADDDASAPHVERRRVRQRSRV